MILMMLMMQSDEEEEDAINDSDTDDSSIDFDLVDSLMLSDMDMIKCFAHTLQLSSKDGIGGSKQLMTILLKVCKLVSQIKRSTSAIEKLELKNAKQVILKRM